MSEDQEEPQVSCYMRVTSLHNIVADLAFAPIDIKYSFTAAALIAIGGVSDIDLKTPY